MPATGSDRMTATGTDQLSYCAARNRKDVYKRQVLGEPSLLGGMKRCINPLLMNESTLCDILEFRVALEIGISDNIFRNLTDADVAELKEIVEMSQVIGNNKYAPVSEHRCLLYTSCRCPSALCLRP